MTEDDTNADEIHTHRAANDEVDASEGAEVDWTAVPKDPDPRRNLGYRLTQWEEIPVANDEDKVIFLPGSEEEIADDAFIVSDTDAICDLGGKR